jgi:hypothetical protein
MGLQQTALISLHLEINRLLHVLSHIGLESIKPAIVPFMQQKGTVLVTRAISHRLNDCLPNRNSLGSKLTVKSTYLTLV